MDKVPDLRWGGVLKSYPVGAIYTSTVATSPADLFGGTWEALPEGRVLLAQGTSYPAGQKGGEATHEITTEEMPSHTHTMETAGAHTHINEFFSQKQGNYFTGNLNSFNNPNGKNGYIGCYDGFQIGDVASPSSPQWQSRSGDTVKNPYHYSKAQSSGTHSHTLNATGGKEDGTTQPISLMQPYLSVYMWRRTA